MSRECPALSLGGWRHCRSVGLEHSGNLEALQSDDLLGDSFNNITRTAPSQDRLQREIWQYELDIRGQRDRIDPGGRRSL